MEHLFDYEFKFTLRQIFKVLKPGGFFRISVPSLEGAIKSYLASTISADRCLRFNQLAYWYGAHHVFFDFGFLSYFLKEAGFVNIQLMDFPNSTFLKEQEVYEFEKRPEESLMVECVKPFL